ncbi:MAG: hypothetical protein A4S09_14350 [Proteobacteria bacterium SG_bin7]|nr:MAG: hypothetical protein A4S09_14350 [Proteobacteria bacterium SG_bin7]
MGTKLFPYVIQSLKRILRRKKVTYRHLAKKIMMSESGLKKIFLGKDISFTRLTQICEVLGISLSDLLIEIEQGDSFQYSFSAAQEAYFLKNRKGFNIFWKLVYERWKPQEIETHYRLSPREINSYLQQLSDLNLVRYKGPGKVKVPRVRAITWRRDGVFTKKLLNEWSLKLLHEQLQAPLTNNGQLQLRYFCFQEHVYRDLLERLKAIEKEFLQNTVRDMNLFEAKDLTRVGWLSVASPTTFVE